MRHVVQLIGLGPSLFLPPLCRFESAPRKQEGALRKSLMRIHSFFEVGQDSVPDGERDNGVQVDARHLQANRQTARHAAR